AAEGTEAGETDVEADIGDAAVALAQQEHRALDPAPLEVAVRRLAEGRAEGPDEVRLGDAGDPGERGDVERLGVAAVHRVARAEQPAVDLLDAAAHGRGVYQPVPAAYSARRGSPRISIASPNSCPR